MDGSSLPSKEEFGTEDYALLLERIKGRVRGAQFAAARTVNAELVLLYWGIGREILERQETRGWGAKVIDRLAADLKRT